ncbi:MAG TPA: arginine--tRNA ligase [Dehalococcoidia bacterium]|nr:arginine--tRNA ligase [Dehalococcoidia bacterium]
MTASGQATIKERIQALIAGAVERAQAAGDLPSFALPDVTIERPQRAEHGDYACSLPLRLARAADARPLDIAAAIVRHLQANEEFAAAAVAPPGFINFRLADSWITAQVNSILAQGPSFGNVDVGAGQKVQVEFVSANPTGPLTVATGRGLSIGDTLAAVLSAAGYNAEREYLINDAGTQTETFASTLFARYQQLFGREVEVPPGAYTGDYVLEIAQEVRDEFGERFLDYSDGPFPPELHDIGVHKMIERIQADLAAIRVRYDSFFSEKSLYASGTYEKAMALLREGGYVAEKEGAVWFTSTMLGDDRDNVLVRSTGKPTYFASDIAYHYDKFLVRGFQRVIDIWGADHQGHVQRMKAAVSALGVDPSQLTIIIHQLITIRRGDQEVRVSKRAGDIITLREVVDEVGADAARFFFVQRAPNSHMDFDLELATRQSSENPVYYVQYAHARIAGILQNAKERIADYSDGDVSLLREESELALVRKLLQLPELIESMTESLETHPLPYYAMELATAFHDFYEKCRVLTDDVPLSKARLKLVAAAKLALARALALMGMTAPEKM